MVNAACAWTTPADTGLLAASQFWPPGIRYTVVKCACACGINRCFLGIVGLIQFDLIGSGVAIVWQYQIDVFSGALSIWWWNQQTAGSWRRTRPESNWADAWLTVAESQPVRVRENFFSPVVLVVPSALAKSFTNTVSRLTSKSLPSGQSSDRGDTLQVLLETIPWKVIVPVSEGISAAIAEPALRTIATTVARPNLLKDIFYIHI